MPNQPRTPVRGVRVPEDLWRAFQHIARERGETPSQVIRDAIVDYVREHDPDAWERLSAE